MPSSLIYTGGGVSGTDASTYTFSSIPLGVPAADRNILVCVGWRSAGSPTVPHTITVDGVTATLLHNYWINNGTGNATRTYIGIYMAAVPTGTDGEIVVGPLSVVAVRCGIAVYSLTGLSSPEVQLTRINSSILASFNFPLTAPAHILVVGFNGNGGSRLSTASGDFPTGTATFSITTASTSNTVWSGITEDSDAMLENVNSGTTLWAGIAITSSSSSSSNYSLTAGSASYVLTGSGATFPRGRTIVAAGTSFVLSGTPANFTRGRRIVAAAAAFAISGKDSLFSRTRTLLASTGSIHLSSPPSLLFIARRMVAGLGSFAISGKPANLIRSGLRLIAAPAQMLIAGAAAIFGTSRKIIAGSASFQITRTPVTFSRGRTMGAGAGGYLYTGADVTMSSTAISVEVYKATVSRPGGSLSSTRFPSFPGVRPPAVSRGTRWGSS